PAGAVLDDAGLPALRQAAQRLERFVRRHFPTTHYHHARQPAEYPRFLRFQRLFFEWLEVWYQARLATGAHPSRHAGDERVMRAARFLDEAPLADGFPSEALPKAAGVGT